MENTLTLSTGLSGKLFSLLNRTLDGLLVAVYALFPIGITIAVIYRYFAGSGILGLEETVLLLVSYIYYLGGAAASRDKVHIDVNLVDLFHLPPRVEKIIKNISDFLTFVSAGAIAYYVMKHWLFVASSRATYPPLGIHMKYYVAGLMIGWILMSIYSLRGFVKTVRWQNAPTMKEGK